MELPTGFNKSEKLLQTALPIRYPAQYMIFPAATVRQTVRTAVSLIDLSEM